MKKVLISFSVIALIAAVAIGATVAYFSDTETSTGNTFTAGSIDLKVDSECTYNGEESDECGTWELKDLVGDTRGENGEMILGDRFFNFQDIKPGDEGENTISLHVINNDAWLCAEVSNLSSDDNGLNEPEALVDTTDGTGNGELDDTMLWTIWRDDGDNIQQENEPTLASGHPSNSVLPVYDATTGTGSLEGGTTTYLGFSWTLPAESGNETQTDSLTADISFRVEQARNNDDFRCVPVQEPTGDQT